MALPRFFHNLAQEAFNFMQPEAFKFSYIEALLRDLIESSQNNWTYSIFWDASLSEQGPLLAWGAGYYNWEKDRGGVKIMDSFSLSFWYFILCGVDSFVKETWLPGQAWQNSVPDPITWWDYLESSSCKRERKSQDDEFLSLILSAFDEGTGLPGQAWPNLLPVPITWWENLASSSCKWERKPQDYEFLSYILSAFDSFAEGTGLPGQAWQSSLPVWITGRENLASYSCERARKAQEFGFRTLVFIPSEIGVIELGSLASNSESIELVHKTARLLYDIQYMVPFLNVQPRDESESSNNIGNNAIVRSSAHLSDENEELSLGLHLGHKAWPVKPQCKANSLSSSVGNYPVPVVKEKENPQFSGKLHVGSDDHSNSSDIDAFVHILKGRRG